MGNPLPTPPGWYQHPSGQQQYWDGQQWLQAPPKAKNNTAIVILCVLTLFFGGCATLVALGSGKSDEKRPTPTPIATAPTRATASEPVAPRNTVAPVGASVRDGKLEFRVIKVESAKTIGDNQFLATTAQGVFVIFTLQVTNIGDRSQNFFAQNQKLIDTQGRSYEASSSATINLEQPDSLGSINPGNTVRAQVAFDVPQSMQMGALELHDSMFSGGVRVAPAAS